MSGWRGRIDRWLSRLAAWIGPDLILEPVEMSRCEVCHHGGHSVAGCSQCKRDGGPCR